MCCMVWAAVRPCSLLTSPTSRPLSILPYSSSRYKPNSLKSCL